MPRTANDRKRVGYGLLFVHKAWGELRRALRPRFAVPFGMPRAVRCSDNDQEGARYEETACRPTCQLPDRSSVGVREPGGSQNHGREFNDCIVCGTVQSSCATAAATRRSATAAGRRAPPRILPCGGDSRRARTAAGWEEEMEGALAH